MSGLHGSVNLNMALLFLYAACGLLGSVSVCLCVCGISSVGMSYCRESDMALPSCHSLRVGLSPRCVCGGGGGWDSSWLLGTRAFLDDLLQGPRFNVLPYVPA